MTIPFVLRGILSDDIIQACMNDDNYGFCTECGEQHDCCEPDARNYECENGCGNTVFGAEELLMMGYAE